MAGRQPQLQFGFCGPVATRHRAQVAVPA
jgi:hypothetical protein